MALINNFGGSNLFRGLPQRQTGSKNQINKQPQISLNKEPQKLEMGQKIELGQLNGSGKTTLDGGFVKDDILITNVPVKTGDMIEDLKNQYKNDVESVLFKSNWQEGRTVCYKGKYYTIEKMVHKEDGSVDFTLREQ